MRSRSNVQEKLVVWIAADAKQLLDLYIQNAIGEISGLGLVDQEGNDVLVPELYLFEQTCTMASTELSQEAVSDFLYDAVVKGIDPGRIKLWWHSHGRLGLFWSGEDCHNIETFGQNCDWLVSIVGVKSGQYLVRLDIFKPFRLTIHEVELRVYYPPDSPAAQQVRAEIAEKVKHVEFAEEPDFFSEFYEDMYAIGGHD